MRAPRLRRQAIACRALTLVLFLSSVPLFAADAAIGVVVDQSGQPLPRAFVRAVEATGSETASAFSDESGRFRLDPIPADCRVEATLTGFATATVPCSAAQRIILQVAPVQETVVVTATRTEATADVVGASVTAFTAADLARRRTALVADEVFVAYPLESTHLRLFIAHLVTLLAVEQLPEG